MGYILVAALCLYGVTAQPVQTLQQQQLIDPEITMNTPQIIQKWGYPVEVHTVQTSDGYLIDMHRIPFGKNGDQTPNKPVIFMEHGLMADSSVWVTNLPEQSAGFLFADAGFDVWLGNVRGNTYGLKHTTMNPQMPEFWEFSFDEHSSLDLPSQIDYVLQRTGKPTLNYIGHSQGSLMMFTHLSEDQQFAQKIENFFALGPIGTMNSVQGLFDTLAKQFNGLDSLDGLFSTFGDGQFKVPQQLISQLSVNCQFGLACQDVLFLAGGIPSISQFNSSRLPVYLSHFPSSVSTQNMAHIIQLINSIGVVPKYDFQDTQMNIEKYKQPTPPLYDYSKVNAPTHLFWGDLDVLADKTDIKSWLLENLDKKWLKTNVELPDFAHKDFIWGLKAPNQIYQPIMNIIMKGSSSMGSQQQQQQQFLGQDTPFSIQSSQGYQGYNQVMPPQPELPQPSPPQIATLPRDQPAQGYQQMPQDQPQQPQQQGYQSVQPAQPLPQAPPPVQPQPQPLPPAQPQQGYQQQPKPIIPQAPPVQPPVQPALPAQNYQQQIPPPVQPIQPLPQAPPPVQPQPQPLPQQQLYQQQIPSPAPQAPAQPTAPVQPAQPQQGYQSVQPTQPLPQAPPPVQPQPQPLPPAQPQQGYQQQPKPIIPQAPIQPIQPAPQPLPSVPQAPIQPAQPTQNYQQAPSPLPQAPPPIQPQPQPLPPAQPQQGYQQKVIPPPQTPPARPQQGYQSQPIQPVQPLPQTPPAQPQQPNYQQQIPPPPAPQAPAQPPTQPVPPQPLPQPQPLQSVQAY